MNNICDRISWRFYENLFAQKGLQIKVWGVIKTPQKVIQIN